MRKILSFFAFAAIVFSFAACGGNEPEVKNFQLKVGALSTNAHIIITPTDNQREYYWYCEEESEIEQIGSVRDYVEHVLSQVPYAELKNQYKLICDEKLDYFTYTDNWPLASNTVYILYVCFIEKEGDFAKISGNVEYMKFTTMPDNTLNGEFTVNNAGKKVHFMKTNMYRKNTSSDLAFMIEQWDCYANGNGLPPYDLFDWTFAKDNIKDVPYFLLSAAEWSS